MDQESEGSDCILSLISPFSLWNLKQLIELEEITKKFINEQRNDEEEADFLTELMDEKPFEQQKIDEIEKEARFYSENNGKEVKKSVPPPELEKTVELFKRLLKSNDVNN